MQIGDRIRYEDGEGTEKEGYIANVLEEDHRYTVRLDNGTLNTVFHRNIIERLDDDPVAPVEPDCEYPEFRERWQDRAKRYAKNALVAAVTVLVIWAGYAVATFRPDPVIGTPLEEDTKELNAANLEAVPLIEACGKLSKVKERQKTIYERIKARMPKE